MNDKNKFASVLAMAAAAGAPSNAPVPACEPAVLDLNDDTPLAPVCDLSGDGACDACQ